MPLVPAPTAPTHYCVDTLQDEWDRNCFMAGWLQHCGMPSSAPVADAFRVERVIARQTTQLLARLKSAAQWSVPQTQAGPMRH